MDKFSDLIENTTFVIPVRLGSSRIKNKVLLPFPNKKINLIEHKINQLLNITTKDKIILSCGERRLIELAESFDIEVSHRDGHFINEHDAGTRESIIEVVKDIPTKYTAWTTVVTPLHDEVVIKKSLESFLKFQKDFDSMTTGVRIYEYLWQDDKPLNYFADDRHVDSQDLPCLTRISNGIYFSQTSIMRQNGYFLGYKPKIIEIPNLCSVDIDTREDYLTALNAIDWYKEIRDEFYSA